MFNCNNINGHGKYFPQEIVFAFSITLFRCTEDYVGDYCEVEDKGNDNTKTLAIALGCVGGVLFLVALVFAYCACKVKATRQRRHRQL